MFFACKIFCLHCVSTHFVSQLWSVDLVRVVDLTIYPVSAKELQPNLLHCGKQRMWNLRHLHMKKLAPVDKGLKKRAHTSRITVTTGKFTLTTITTTDHRIVNWTVSVLTVCVAGYLEVKKYLTNTEKILYNFDVLVQISKFHAKYRCWGKFVISWAWLKPVDRIFFPLLYVLDWELTDRTSPTIFWENFLTRDKGARSSKWFSPAFFGKKILAPLFPYPTQPSLPPIKLEALEHYR